MGKQMKLAVLLLAALVFQMHAELQINEINQTAEAGKKQKKIYKKKQVKKAKKATHKKTKKSCILKLTEANAISFDSQEFITVNHKQYKEIRVQLGRALVTKGNITAWKLANQSGPLGEVKYKQVEPSGQLMGSAGTDKFTFKITGTGKATLEFGHELQTPDGTPLNERLEPPSIYFSFDIK